MKYYKIIIIVLGILINSNAYSQDSAAIYKKHLCKTWRLIEGYSPGSDISGTGWKSPKTTNYLLDNKWVILTTYNSDNTFKVITTIKDAISKKDSVIVESGTWSLNIELNELREMTLFNNGKPLIFPLDFNYEIITLTNDTLKTAFVTIGGAITHTYIPYKNN